MPVGAWKSPSPRCALYIAGLNQDAEQVVAFRSVRRVFPLDTRQDASLSAQRYPPKGTPKPTCSGTEETADLEGNRQKATAVTVVWTRGFRVQRSCFVRWPHRPIRLFPVAPVTGKSQTGTCILPTAPLFGKAFEPKCIRTEARMESQEAPLGPFGPAVSLHRRIEFRREYGKW
jgi:hypothetical protein